MRRRRTALMILPLLPIAGLVIMTALASPARSLPTYTSACNGCHSADGTTISVTLQSQTATTATYAVSGSSGNNGGEGWGVFSGSTKVFNGFGPGTFTVNKDGASYTVYWVDRNTAGNAGSATTSITAPVQATTYTLTYSAGPGGSITGVSTQTVDSGADGSTVTAVADTGYHFVNWSDGVMTASRTDTGVTSDISVTASFAADTITPGDTEEEHADDDEDDEHDELSEEHDELSEEHDEAGAYEHEQTSEDHEQEWKHRGDHPQTEIEDGDHQGEDRDD